MQDFTWTSLTSSVKLATIHYQNHLLIKVAGELEFGQEGEHTENQPFTHTFSVMGNFK